MSRTLTPKNEIPQHTERPLRDRVEEELPITTSAQVDPISSTSTNKVKERDSQASVSAQPIREERREKSAQELNHTPSPSELSYIASLQMGRLGDEQPNAGFGSPNLPFGN
jgi:hypothetical protein